MNLREIKKAWKDCRRCPLAADRTGRAIVGANWKPRNASRRGGPRILVVCPPPQRDAVERGVPLAGRRRQALDDVLVKAGVTNAYVTNVCACRPPAGRRPTPAELSACRPRMLSLFAHLKPRAIVLVGDDSVSFSAVLPDGTDTARIADSSTVLKAGWPSSDKARELLAEQTAAVRALLPEKLRAVAPTIESGVSVVAGQIEDSTRTFAVEVDSVSGRITSEIPRGRAK